MRWISASCVALSISVAAFAGGGCASVVGLDDLTFDRGDGGGGGGDASTSSSTSASTSSSTSASTGGPFVVSGDASEYQFLMSSYDTAFYRFDETGLGEPVEDRGMSWDGNYVVDPDSDVSLGQSGVFPNNASAAFRNGGAIQIYRVEPYPYLFLFADDDEGAFTISFFAKVDAPLQRTIQIAACFDDAAQRGWLLTLDQDGVVFTRYGEDEGGGDASETTPPFALPTDGAWHLVTVQKLSGGGELRGFLDGTEQFHRPSVVRRMVAHDADLFIGNDPDDPTSPALALDEMVFVPYGLSDRQLEVQITCLQGGSCEPPPLEP